MAGFDSLSSAEAQELARLGLQLRQLLQNVQDGYAGPLRPGRYTSAEIDAAVQEFVAYVQSSGAGAGDLATVQDDVPLEVPVTGTYTDFITPTVVDGVITGFVLS